MITVKEGQWFLEGWGRSHFIPKRADKVTAKTIRTRLAGGNRDRYTVTNPDMVRLVVDTEAEAKRIADRLNALFDDQRVRERDLLTHNVQAWKNALASEQALLEFHKETAE